MNGRTSARRRWIARFATALLLGLGAQAAWAVPIFTSAPVTAVNEDAAYVYNITTGDIAHPNDNRLVSVQGTLPAGLTLQNVNQNQGTARIQGNPTQPGVYTVTLIVTNTTRTEATGTQTFPLTVTNVNDPPQITGQTPNPVPAQEDTALTLQLANLVVTDPDNTYPTGFTLSAQNGANYSRSGNTITPNLNFVGTLSVPVTVNDGSANSNTFNVQVAVSGANDAPQITGQTPNPIAAQEDTALTIQLGNLLVTDPDNSYPTGFTLSVQNGTNYTRNGNTITPTLNFFGTLSVPALVNDGTANSNTFNLQVAVASVNDAPTFTSTPPTGASQGALYTYSVTTADPDTANLRTVSAAPGTTLPVWLSLSNVTTTGTATLSGTPGPTHVGVFPVTLRVTDNGTPALFADQAFTITVNNTNDPPTFTSAPVLTANEDAVYTYSIITADPDPTDTRTISVGPGTTLPAWLTLTNINPTAGTATLSGTPLQAHVGAHSVTLRVTDNGTPTPLFATQAFTITVSNVNDPPKILAPIPAQLGVENAPFQLKNAAGAPVTLAAFFADDDVGDVLTYQVTGLPPGGRLVANPTTGAITGTPLTADARDTPYVIQATASDGKSLPASLPTQTFNLTIARIDRADVSLTTTVAPAPALRNVNVDWTFTIGNGGPQVSSAITLSAEFAGNPFSFTALGNCSVTPAGGRQVVSCTVPAVAAGASTQVVISGQAAQAGDVNVTADAHGAAAAPADPNLTNNVASTTLNIAQSLSTGPAQLLPSPDNTAAATGDFNGDGFMDVVVTKGSAAGTEVYLNVESPTNPAQRAFSTTPRVLGDQTPSSDVAAVDLDNDGDLDIVTTNSTGKSNDVFLNSGGAAFTLFATLGAGNTNAVATADFNGDGRLDLAFANASAAVVYLNAPGPAFTAGAAIGTGDGRELVAADFDLDGLPDLVIANADGQSRFHKNLGAGQFGVGVIIDNGGAVSVTSADFNGDSRPDVAFARVASAAMPPSIIVYQNNPGGPTAPLFVLVAGLGAAPTVDLLANDVDLDSFADIVAIGASGTHQVYRGNGAGGFSLHPTQFLLAGASGGAFGKLSVDNRVDLALGGSPGTGVFFNDGRGGLGPGDTDRPVIQLLGEASIEIEIGATYQDAGATATDQIDGSLTAAIVTNNPVNTRIIGNYTVTYDVTDSSGNAAARVTRSVRVAAREGTGGGGGGAIGGPLALLGLLLCLLAYVRERSRSRL